MAKTIEAVENALTFLEALGYTSGGDIHDDLAGALETLRNHERTLFRLVQAVMMHGHMQLHPHELNAAVKQAAEFLAEERQ